MAKTLGLMLAGLLLIGSTTEPAHAQSKGIPPSAIRSFNGGFSKTMTVGRSQKRPVLVIISATEYCAACVKMARNVFSREDVGQFYNENYVVMEIDAATTTGKLAAGEFGIQGIPTFIIYDPISNSRRKDRMEYRQGYLEPAAFIEFGKSNLTKFKSTHGLK